MSQRAVFLDRDGVLVADIGLATHIEHLQILPGVPEALCQLKTAGFKLIVVTNQTVVARGMLSQTQLDSLHVQLGNCLREKGAPAWDALYTCPHHPNATLPEYRVVCDCRKPQPGMILRAIREHNLAPECSFMVGDRISDIKAGLRGGCKTVWLTTGQHDAPPIESAHAADQKNETCAADHVCESLLSATNWILSQA
jgi:D-glycero-D-manno-heptose 1,7-bisphosphate phosphatase